MRRRILLLLLMLLPFQFCWSAAAAYCRHESGATTVHLGHHFHVHKAVSQADPAAGALAGLDGDCPSCVLHADGPSLPPDIAALAASVAHLAPVPSEARAAPPPPPSLPERPNWAWPA
jgi:hypothetical protein